MLYTVTFELNNLLITLEIILSAYYNTFLYHIHCRKRGRRGRDRMVVGFTTTYAISSYYHWCWEFESLSGRDVQHYAIKFVSDLRQVGGFSPVPPVSSTYKTYRHDITEILLKVAINTTKQTKNTVEGKIRARMEPPSLICKLSLISGYD